MGGRLPREYTQQRDRKLKELILIGGGGHCRSAIDVIETSGEYAIYGILDNRIAKDSNVFGYSVLGGDELIAGLTKKNYHFLITVGQIKSPSIREDLYNTVKKHGGTFATVLSPLAHVSKHAKVNEGTLVMHHAVINAGAVVGANCVINTKALIEHDVQIGPHNHVATSAVINGDAVTGSGCFVGSNSVILQGITLARNTVVGAGAVIRKNVSEENTTVFG